MFISTPRPAVFRNRLLCTSAATGLLLGLTPPPVAAQGTSCDRADVPVQIECPRPNDDITVVMPVGENTSRLLGKPGADFDTKGFSISIEGQTIAGADAPPITQRPNDLALEGANIQVTYDGLEVTPRLNVTTTDLRAAYRAGEAVTFRSSTNYPAFLSRAEIRITDRSTGLPRVVATLPVAPNGQATWAMPADGTATYDYILRVYDEVGRYNETAPLELTRTTTAFDDHATSDGPPVAAGEGEDRTKVANIPLNGGSVTTYGTDVPEGRIVRVMGEEIAVDPNGGFVIQRILPPGDRLVDVTLNGGAQPPQRLAREIEIPKNDWFFVGIADVTIGARIEDQLEEASGEDDDFYANGRAGLYLKGRIQGKYLITASVDSGDGDIEDIFERIDDKDPRWILEQLDPDDFYPVYGDDSTAIDDTPSTRRFYVRIERDDSFALWGDFNANFNETEYLQNNRELYGARARYVTPQTTENGDSRLALDLYVANPETLPQRDILQGTGGSAYFLSRQAIRAASETLYIEVREEETDRVIERIALVAGQDYDIDYLQGVVILRQPLASTATSNGVVRDAVLGENQLFLIAQYEFTPTFGDTDGTSVGVRTEVQPFDRLRLGFTAMRETTGAADQELLGADLELQVGQNSYVEAEIASSEGPGFDRTTSTDGGLIINDDPTNGTGDTAALAVRLSGLFDLRDLGVNRDGELGLYYEYEEGGFSSFTENISDDQNLYGGFGRIELTERVTLSFAGEDFDSDNGEEVAEANIDLAYQLRDNWLVEGGVAYEDKENPGQPDETGERTDLGLRLTWAPSEDLSLYWFGQITVASSGGISDNDRTGVGIEYQLTERLSAAAEVSEGDLGFGALAKLSYSPTADEEVYIGYTLDPTRSGIGGGQSFGRDHGQLVFGERHRLNERLTTYGENTYDLFGQRRSLTSIYGIDYTPNARWAFVGGVEIGEINDDINGDFDREAFSLGVTFVDEDLVRANARIEFRDEDGDGLTRDRQTYAFSGGYEYKTSDDWRVLSNVDLLISDSNESSFRDGEYVEASVGYAYRPVENERTNALLRYTYLLDLPGVDQITASGSAEGLQQESHIISGDVIQDLNETFTLGAKYGYRRSEVAERTGADIFDSNAHLGILRLDWHIVHKWDLISEARLLYTEQGDTTETGYLVEIDRHVGNNLKVGLGYEFGNVSSDIGDINYTAQGIFVNLTAKF